MRTAAVLGYFVAMLCGLLSWSSGVEAVCATARVRKSYDALTLIERTTYRKALQISMDKGYYIKFVEMHMEKMSEMEAHRVCMFTYWHRYFLLGFENMLRSLGPEYECVTVPYWDEMQGNARALAGNCTNIETCSLIARDMGGSSSGLVKGITINGAWVSGNRCVNTAPLSHFCESSSKTGTACARCLPRTNWQTKKFPSATNFASVYRQLFTSGAFVTTGSSIENGMHNSIHAELGGAMGTFQSPADPVFWSHHAYVDLLLTIYLKCRVGLGVLTDEQKKNNQYAFVQCPHREDAGFFTSSSAVTMRNGELGVNPKQVSQSGQVLYPFFLGLPNKYYQLSDVTQLGANRYTYSVGGLVGQMASKCGAATGTRRLQEQERVGKTALRPGCHSDLEETQTPSNHEESSSQAPLGPDLPKDFTVDHSDDTDPAAKKMNDWIDDVRDQLRTAAGSSDQSKPLDEKETVEQLEKMVCMFYDQCRGGVQDYSDEFKKAFHVSEPPPCKRIVDELKSKTTPSSEKIQLPEWKQVMEKYFPCEDATPVPPAYDTESGLYDDSSSGSGSSSDGM